MENLRSSELRIGNLVTHNYQNDEVFSLSGFILYKLTVTENTGDELFVKPIKLTEEWLLRFGFVVIETNAGIECFYFGKRYSVLQPSNTDVWLLVDGEKGLCEIKHVHQLQNLYFALCGQELAIVK